MQRSRRQFLQTAIGSSAVVAVGAPIPQFLKEVAATEPDKRQATVLVVLQLSGGNDGLNTIVPYADDEYRKQRPELRIGESSVLRIDDYCGFHPALRGFADLLENGQLAMVQGVGYENPNRSHFESMDIWHTCRRDQRQRAVGWLGKYLDASTHTSNDDLPAVHFGSEQQPLALAARDHRVPSLPSLEALQLQGNAEELSVLSELAEVGRESESTLLDFVRSSSTSALAAGERVQLSSSDYKTAASYPDYNLAKKLQLVAQLIDADLGTRVFYVMLDGFDTHSRQADAHTGLLRQVGDSVSAFLQDVAAHDHGARVLVMAFSEFGRRVQENASVGTDHGAAGPMFCAGSPVRSGLVGKHPSLTDLDGGDLKYHTDFRQVYATILEQWLGCGSVPIVGGHYTPLPLLQA